MLLDNLDEVVPRGAVAQALAKVTRLFPETKIVAACRRSALPPFLDSLGTSELNVAELALLEGEQMRLLVESHLELEAARALWERITARGLLEVASNPFALWRLVSVWEQQGEAAEVSDNRGQIMSAYVRCLLARAPNGADAAPLRAARGRQALAAWAFTMTRSHLTARPREEAVAEFTALLGGRREEGRLSLESAVVCKVLTYAACSLVGPTLYLRFDRRELQDLFAAEHLAQGRGEVDVGALVKDAEWGWEPIILLTGILPPSERLEWMSRVLASTEDPVLLLSLIHI